PLADDRPGESGRSRDCRNLSPAHCHGLAGCQQPPGSFIQFSGHSLVSLLDLFFSFHVSQSIISPSICKPYSLTIPKCRTACRHLRRDIILSGKIQPENSPSKVLTIAMDKLANKLGLAHTSYTCNGNN